MKLNSLAELTDGQVWSLFKEGDINAYGYIYDQHFKLLYNYGLHLVQKVELVEDCIQELFFYLLTHKEGLSQVTSIKYYLFRSLRRRIYEAVKREEKMATKEGWTEDYDFEVTFSFEQTLVKETIEKERLEALRQAINALPRRQREALFLIYYENMAYTEVADIMGLKVKTVYNLIHNALLLLKKSLRKDLLLLFFSILLKVQ